MLLFILCILYKLKNLQAKITMYINLLYNNGYRNLANLQKMSLKVCCPIALLHKPLHFYRCVQPYLQMLQVYIYMVYVPCGLHLLLRNLIFT